jgi:hypothetical protein
LFYKSQVASVVKRAPRSVALALPNSVSDFRVSNRVKPFRVRESVNAVYLKKSFVVSAVAVESGVVRGWVATAFGSSDGEHYAGVPVVFFNQISKLFAPTSIL